MPSRLNLRRGVSVDRMGVPMVIFTYAEVTAPRRSNASSIVGRVIGPLEQLSPLPRPLD